MADIATLGLKIETSQVEAGIKSLDRLQQSGDKAASAAANLEQSSSRLSGAMRQVGGAASNAASASSNVTTEMMKLAAAVTLAYTAYRNLSDVISTGMKLETMEVVMGQVGKNVGISREALHYFTEEVKSAGVTTTEAMSAISKAMILDLNLNKMKEFATRVRDVAVGARDAQGNLLNTSQTMMRVMHGIESSQVEILRTLGVAMRPAEIYMKEYAVSIGKTKDELNQAHRSQATLNEFMRASAPLAGAAAAADATVGKQLHSMARYSETAKEALWNLFKPGMEVGVLTLTNAFKELKTWADTNETSLNTLGLQVGSFVGQAGAAGLGAAKWAVSNKDLLFTIAELYLCTKAAIWIFGLTTAFVGAYTAAGGLAGIITGTLLPALLALEAGAGILGIVKTLQGKAGYATPEDPYAAMGQGPGAVGGAVITPTPEIVGPPAPSPSQIQMNLIKEDIKRYQREADEAAAEALAKKPEGTGKGGKGAEGAEASLKRFIETMNQETARGAGDTEAILDAWYGKQRLALAELEAKVGESLEAQWALWDAYESKKRKLESDFNDWYSQGLGNQYEQLVAQERKKLAEVAGNAEKVAKVQEVFDRKHYDLSQSMGKEIEDLNKGNLQVLAQAAPFLSEQLTIERQIMEIEISRNQAEQEIKLSKLMVWDADKGYYRFLEEAEKAALRAGRERADEARRFAQERKEWAKGGGFGAGLQLYREDLDKRPAMFSGVWWKESMSGAENWIGSTFANTALDIFQQRKTDFRAMGQQMLAGLIGEGAKGLFRTLLLSMEGGGSGGVQGGWDQYRNVGLGAINAVKSAFISGENAMTAAGAAGQAARMSGLVGGAGQTLGILGSLAKGTIIIDAGQAAASGFKSVMQVVPFPINIVLAPIVAAAAFAATLAFGSGFGGGGGYQGVGPGNNMSIYPSPYAEGGIISRPTVALMGEAGYPEAVIPMRGGNIPVRFTGSGAGQVVEHHYHNTIQVIATDSEDVKRWAKKNGGGIVTAHRGLAPNEILVKALRDEWILQPSATRSLADMGVSFDMLNAGRVPAMPMPIASGREPSRIQVIVTAHRGLAPNEILVKALRDEWIDRKSVCRERV